MRCEAQATLPFVMGMGRSLHHPYLLIALQLITTAYGPSHPVLVFASP